MAPAFPVLSRVIHWLMAAMILAMLFIGVGMVTTPKHYDELLSIHRPLGIAVLILAAVRLINRLINRPPPLPPGMPGYIKASAELSHIALYVLMFATPLAGWAMLSAGGFPIVLFGALHLPPILPQSIGVYAGLRHAHTALALLFFLVFLVHFAAALAHALLFRDGMFESMTTGGTPGVRPKS